MKNLIQFIFVVFAACFLMAVTSNDIKLKTKSLLNNQIELKIPVDFSIMSKKDIEQKYSNNQNPPTLVYTNKDQSVNLAFNLTDSPANQEMIETYKDFLEENYRNAYPDAWWKNVEVIELNGRKVAYLELITPIPESKIYNRIFLTDLNDKLLLCSFNCTIEKMSKWENVSKEIMQSLKLK